MNVIEILKKAEEAQRSDNPQVQELGRIVRMMLERDYRNQIKPKKFCSWCGMEDEDYNIDVYYNNDGSIIYGHPDCYLDWLEDFKKRTEEQK